MKMERYLQEKDHYKEFLVGYVEEKPLESRGSSCVQQRTTPDLEEWNRLWALNVYNKDAGQGSSPSTTPKAPLTYMCL